MTEGSSPDDLYIAALARELSDGDRLHIGANQADVQAAAALAIHTWAPRLRAVGGGAPLLRASSASTIVGRRWYDRSTMERRDATFHQARAFDDCRRAPIVFAGGLQVDRMGNVNLVAIEDGERMVVCGPGSAGLPTLTSHAPRFYVACPVHTPRILVERVSRISVLSAPEPRRALGLTGGLVAVITPLARFEPGEDGLELVEHAPGTDLDEIDARTGFTVRAAASLRERPALTARESATLEAVRHAATTSERWRG